MKVFEKQGWHLIILLLFLVGIQRLVQNNLEFLKGSLWGYSTKNWCIMAISIPILHQVYVLFCWRLELHYKLLTKKIGKNVFNLYLVGFFILFVSRMIFLWLLAISNRSTFRLNKIILIVAFAAMTLLVVYAFYSVKKYFGFKRAAGLDHFDPSIAELPFVKEGIFKHTKNGMYKYAFLAFYLPGLLMQSKLALLVAVFSHLYIWVHYYCTELPDIKRIYSIKKNNK